MSLRAAAFVIALAVRCFPDWDAPTGRRRALSLAAALRLTLCRLRRKATYQDLHEDVGIAKSTAWAYHQTMVAVGAEVLGADDGSLSALVAGRVCLVDGPLIPTVHGRHRRDLYSGKHRRHGVNLQLLVDPHGRILAAGRAFPDCWHDLHCFRDAGWVELVHASGGGIGDVGYQGEPDAVHTPIKKPLHRNLAAVERDLNHDLARLRVGVEGGAGHLTNGRITTTRYRADLTRIDANIQA